MDAFFLLLGRPGTPHRLAAVLLCVTVALPGCGPGPGEAWTPEPTRVEETLGWTQPADPRPSDLLPLDESGLRGFSSFVVEEWFSPQWAAMGLEPLYARAGEAGVEVYRFVEVPTWAPAYAVTLEVDPVRMTAKPERPEAGGTGEAATAAWAVYREWAQGRVAELRYVVLDGAGGYEPGGVAARGERVVSHERATAFRGLFEAVGFWNKQTRDTRIGADGTQWVLEVLRDGRYHVVDRWTPERSGRTEAFVAAAEWLRAEAAAVPRPFR